MFVGFAINPQEFFVTNNKDTIFGYSLIDKQPNLVYTILANKIYEKGKAKLTVLHDLFKAKQLVEY